MLIWSEVTFYCQPQSLVSQCILKQQGALSLDPDMCVNGREVGRGGKRRLKKENKGKGENRYNFMCVNTFKVITVVLFLSNMIY